MYFVIIISLAALILTYLDSTNKQSGGMKYAFVLITIVGAIHYDYGNDYMAYYDMYEKVSLVPFNIISVLEGDVLKEPGWALLCYLFKPIGGFFMMVAVLNIIQNVLIYKNIKSYVDKKWWPMAIFIYLFSTSFYLLNFSMMRQGLVICVFFGMWPWIKEKKIIRSLITLLLCSLVHTSAVILLPFAFWGVLSFRNSRVWAIVLLVLFLALWIVKDFLNGIFGYLMLIEQFDDYASYYALTDDRELSFGLGYLMNTLPFFLSLFYLFFNNDSQKQSNQLVILAAISFLITPFTTIIPLIERVRMYFAVYLITSLPIVYSCVRNKILRYGLIFIFVFLYLYDYRGWFYSDVWMDSYRTYQTIFSVL